MRDHDSSSKPSQLLYLLGGLHLLGFSIHSMMESYRLGYYVFMTFRNSSSGDVAAAQIVLCFVGGAILVSTSLKKLMHA